MRQAGQADCAITLDDYEVLLAVMERLSGPSAFDN
jgi:hypothetical protein